MQALPALDVSVDSSAVFFWNSERERMKQFIDTIGKPGTLWRAIALCLVLIVAVGWIAVRIERRIVQARTVTQTHVEEGWKKAGLAMTNQTIRRGDNFWKVAKEHRVDIDTIIGANAGLKKLLAHIGQIIRVPSQRGAVHRIEGEETVQDISVFYAAPEATIMATNNLEQQHILPPGLEIFIPGAKPRQLTAEMARHFSRRGIFGSPLLGRITSTMGMRKHPVGGFRGKHTGVDLAAPTGSRIAAATAGTVKDVGQGKYIGKYVVLSHKNAYTTLYGHCSKTLVKKGQTVKRGQIIARVGSTGRATGPHLHFELRENGIPRDPLRYLW